MKNLAAHYERMSIVKPSWENCELMGIRDMLAETVNQNSKDKSPVPNMAALVLQAILSGAGYPASLYTDVLIRIRARREQRYSICAWKAVFRIGVDPDGRESGDQGDDPRSVF